MGAYPEMTQARIETGQGQMEADINMGTQEVKSVFEAIPEETEVEAASKKVPKDEATETIGALMDCLTLWSRRRLTHLNCASITGRSKRYEICLGSKKIFYEALGQTWLNRQETVGVRIRQTSVKTFCTQLKSQRCMNDGHFRKFCQHRPERKKCW
jgi:hypothetical protein